MGGRPLRWREGGEVCVTGRWMVGSVCFFVWGGVWQLEVSSVVLVGQGGGDGEPASKRQT